MNYSWMWLIPILFGTMILLCMLFTEGGIINSDCIISEGKSFKIMLTNCDEQIDREVLGNWTITGFGDNTVYLLPDLD